MEIKTCKACSRFCHLQTANNSPNIRQAPAYVPGAKICYPQREIAPVWAWLMMCNEEVVFLYYYGPFQL